MSNSILYMTFGGLGAAVERKSERGVWTMAEFTFGFIWVVVARLESGSACLLVNFPYSLGFFWHPTEGDGSRSKWRLSLTTRPPPKPSPQDCKGSLQGV